MKFGDAVIELKGDLRPLRKALSSVRSDINAGLARAGDWIASGMKKAFDAAVMGVKVGVAAMIGTLILATKNALEAEAAELKLAAALEATGKGLSGLLPEMKAYATEIQKMTTVGDEETLGLMQYGLSLGLTAEQIKEATKMSIGLAKALGSDVSSAMRYIAMAMQGEYTVLRRYIPALREAKTQEEAMIAIQELATRGLAIATAEIDTATGSWQQLKNSIGDVLEVIGAPLTSEIKELNKWFNDNREKIDGWATKAAEAIEGVVAKIKELGQSFVDAFKEGGWDAVLEEVRVIAKKVGDTFISTFGEAIRKGIGEAIMFALKSLDPLKAAQNLGWLNSGPSVGLKREMTNEERKAAREYGVGMGYFESQHLRGELNSNLKRRQQSGRIGDKE